MLNEIETLMESFYVSPITVREVAEEAYLRAVERAAEWLEANTHYDNVGGWWCDCTSKQDFINEFKKGMKQ